MRYVFVVQGEGRGHFTQALSMAQLLRSNGDEVVGVLVGRSPSRKVPSFFMDKINAPVEGFVSPNFIPSHDGRRSDVLSSLLYNVKMVPDYLESVLWLRKKIVAYSPDCVINFYDLLCGLMYGIFRPDIPLVCVGHQYLFLHRDFEFPKCNSWELFGLKLFTRLTCLNSSTKMALSFYAAPDDVERRVVVVPPLLRKELFEQKSIPGSYVHGYMINSGYERDIRRFHAAQPSCKLRFFWDKKGVDGEVKVDETLSFYSLNDTLFIQSMAGSKAYATTAGFESICEAIYLEKPVMMIPVHIEQACNAHDAARVGAGIISDSFEIDRLLTFSSSYVPNQTFKYWVKEAPHVILSTLANVAAGVYVDSNVRGWKRLRKNKIHVNFRSL